MPLNAIAIVTPLADYGINLYSAELAEGLAANGILADVYTSTDTAKRQLPSPHSHRRFDVLGSVLYKQRAALKSIPTAAIGQPTVHGVEQAGKTRSLWACPASLRTFVLRAELAFHLKNSGYDAVWTQWPYMPEYGNTFRRFCRRLGLTVIHTVHNILPHEPVYPRDLHHSQAIYRQCDHLIVHSEDAYREFVTLFPDLAGRVIVAAHGTYTLFPRNPAARTKIRQMLDIDQNTPLLLFSGAIRPYKNIDSVLHAMALRRPADVVLVVAGSESHYADATSTDPLRHTRTLAARLGILERVRLIPRHLSNAEMAELFEAADIAIMPYIKGYGSGMLLLAMTFGKHIISTPVGGAEEYLRNYRNYTLVPDGSAQEIAEGLAKAISSLASYPQNRICDDPCLSWREIARSIINRVA